MEEAKGVVAPLHIVGMIDPRVESEGGVGKRLVNEQHGSICQAAAEGVVVIVYVIAHTSRNGDSGGIVDFKIGDASVGIHKLEGNGYVGDGLAAVVDDAECDSVFFEIDTADATR